MCTRSFQRVPAQRAGAALGGLADLHQGRLGGLQQGLAALAPLAPQARVAAYQQPLAGVVRALDPRQLPVPDLLGIETPLAQGGDPAELLVGGQVLADARRGKHAAIADQHHAAEPEAPPQLVDLGGHGGGVAGAHLGGNRAARGVAPGRRGSGGCHACRRGSSRGGGAGADDGAAVEQQGDAVDQRLGELGEVGVGDLADLAVVPVGGAEQDGRGRVAVGDALDVHGYDYGTRRETMSSTNVLETRIYRHGSRAAARAMEGSLHGY